MSSPTWLNLNSPGLVPPLGTRGAPEISPVAFMISPGPDFNFMVSLMGKGRTRPFFSGSIFTAQGDSNKSKGPALAGPYLGAPCGTMILESLIAKGAETIIVFGWCGAIDSRLSPGDILLPDSGLVDEGTSKNYMEYQDDTPISYPSRDLTRTLGNFFKERDISFKTGPVWSTDAIYRETREKIAFFKEKGALAVEMECSALFSVARFRKCSLAAVVIVSDDLTGPTWSPGFKDSRFKESRKKIAAALYDFGRFLI